MGGSRDAATSCATPTAPAPTLGAWPSAVVSTTAPTVGRPVPAGPPPEGAAPGGSGAFAATAGSSAPAAAGSASRWASPYRWDAATVMFFPARGRTPAENRSVVQRFDGDSVHHGPTADDSGGGRSDG